MNRRNMGVFGKAETERRPHIFNAGRRTSSGSPESTGLERSAPSQPCCSANRPTARCTSSPAQSSTRRCKFLKTNRKQKPAPRGKFCARWKSKKGYNSKSERFKRSSGRMCRAGTGMLWTRVRRSSSNGRLVPISSMGVPNVFIRSFARPYTIQPARRCHPAGRPHRDGAQPQHGGRSP